MMLFHSEPLPTIRTTNHGMPPIITGSDALEIGFSQLQNVQIRHLPGQCTDLSATPAQLH